MTVQAVISWGAGGEQSAGRRCWPGIHQWYDGTPHPWEFGRGWYLEPSLTDVEGVHAGAEDVALFKSGDGGQSWQELSGNGGAWLRPPRWQPGAGGDVLLHITVILDLLIQSGYDAAISWRRWRLSERIDGGKMWKPINHGLRSQGIPDPDAEVGTVRIKNMDASFAARSTVHAEALGT